MFLDIDEFITDATKTRWIYIEELNRKIPYKKLTISENASLLKIDDAEKRAHERLYLMLNKADKKITKEKIQQLGNDVGTIMLMKMLTRRDFLLPIKNK